MPAIVPKSTEGRSYLIPNKPYSFTPEQEITVPGYYDENAGEWVEEYTYTRPRYYVEVESDGHENGGRTWARMLTPVIGVASANPSTYPFPIHPEKAIGHGYAPSRTYDEQCYGLLRGLNGGTDPRKNSNFNIRWEYTGVYTYVYDPELESGYWWIQGDPGSTTYDLPPDYYTSGKLIGSFYSSYAVASAIHFFAQDELEYTLNGASVITAGGTVAISNDLLTQYHLTSNAEQVTLMDPAPYGDYHPPPPAIHVLGMTDVNT